MLSQSLYGTPPHRLYLLASFSNAYGDPARWQSIDQGLRRLGRLPAQVEISVLGGGMRRKIKIRSKPECPLQSMGF